MTTVASASHTEARTVSAGRGSGGCRRPWRESNPWHALYRDVAARHHKSNAGKAAVARKILIAAWHVLSREQPFKACRPRGGADPVPASSHFHLAA